MARMHWIGSLGFIRSFKNNFIKLLDDFWMQYLPGMIGQNHAISLFYVDTVATFLPI